MGELKAWKPRPRKLTLDEAERATRKADALAAEFPTLSGSIETVRRQIAADREKAGTWSFLMVGPRELLILTDLMMTEAKRPKLSARLWAAMLCRIQADSGRVKMTTAEMLAAVETRSKSAISEALKEFTAWGALQRVTHGREVHWFINPNIATHLQEHARPWAQQQQPNVVQLEAMRDQLRRQRATRAAPTATAHHTDSGIINDPHQPPLIDD